MDRFAAAVDAIDAANADDPNTIIVDGRARAKEQAHAEMMTAWVKRLDPVADELQLLAARAHHLRRWSIPRDSYPEGRAGYLRWRAALKRQHSNDVGGILNAVGYDDDEIDRVGRIIRKEGLVTDPAVQTHEDALCLVFLQTQLGDLCERLGDAKAIDVLAKTLPKMSRGAKEHALGLDLDGHSRSLLLEAVGLAEGP
ncbi:MAG: hypothetical protein JJLCMIEE_02181 [Acidimicrobiales bacterium]|nr:hypothetical protein [Acidimicrobiales bacterium]